MNCYAAMDNQNTFSTLKSGTTFNKNLKHVILPMETGGKQKREGP